MLIGRQNPRGGPKLKPNCFPLKSDPNTKEFGLLIGYTKDGEYVLCPLSLAEEVANRFGYNLGGYRKLVDKMTPAIPFKQKLFIWLFGKRTYLQLKESYERGDLT